MIFVLSLYGTEGSQSRLQLLRQLPRSFASSNNFMKKDLTSDELNDHLERLKDLVLKIREDLDDLISTIDDEVDIKD